MIKIVMASLLLYTGSLGIESECLSPGPTLY